MKNTMRNTIMHCLTALETTFQAAKERLEAAQQEKLEAAADFLSVRAALRQALETQWPVPCPCGETELGKDRGIEKDGRLNWV